MDSEASARQELVLENCRILVIDDNEDIHEDFRKILCSPVSSGELEQWEEELFGERSRPAERIFCEIDTATQGQEGFEKVCSALARETPYAAVIIDMRMPPGWDGLETARRIALEDPAIQLVICTAYSDYSATDITNVFGNSDRLLILKKPFDAMEVQFLVTALVAKWNQACQSEQRFRALEHSEEEHRTLTEHDPDSIVSLDRDGIVQFANHAITGRNLVSVGDSIFAITDDAFPDHPHEFQELFERVVQEKKRVAREWQATLPYGLDWIFWRLIPIIQKNEVVSVKLIATDVSERKRTEQALREAEETMRQKQKMESLGSLAGGIAHDFNNLLAVILGYAEMATTESDSTVVQDDIEQIRVAGGRAKDLVQQILAFSGRGTQRPEYMDLRAIVEETLDLIRASFPAPTELESTFSEDQCTVYADPNHIHQIVMNLMVNAGQSLTDGLGTLSVRVDPVQIDTLPEGAIIPVEAGEYVCVTVADTGCGIADENRARVFEPFFSTKASATAGSGMGLAAVHGFVGSYKGTVSVHSVVDEGTVFKIYLPRAHGKVSTKLPRENPSIGSFDVSILLVDDEPLAVEMLKQMLEKLGCQVETAVNGQEALASVREDPARFDLVLTDHAMPRMTGYMLARELGLVRADLPVILCSGYNEKVLGLPSAGTPISLFLRKPITLAELSRALELCLP